MVINNKPANQLRQQWGRVLYSYIGAAAGQMLRGCMTNRGTIAAS